MILHQTLSSHLDDLFQTLPLCKRVLFSVVRLVLFLAFPRVPIPGKTRILVAERVPIPSGPRVPIPGSFLLVYGLMYLLVSHHLHRDQFHLEVVLERHL